MVLINKHKIDAEINEGLTRYMAAQLKQGALNDDIFFESLISLKKQGTHYAKATKILEKYNLGIASINEAQKKSLPQQNISVFGHILVECSPYMVTVRRSESKKRSGLYELADNIRMYQEAFPDFLNNLYSDTVNKMIDHFESCGNDNYCVFYESLELFLSRICDSFVKSPDSKTYKNGNKIRISMTMLFENSEKMILDKYGLYFDNFLPLLVNDGVTLQENKGISFISRLNKNKNVFGAYPKQQFLLKGLLNYVQNSKVDLEKKASVFVSHPEIPSPIVAETI